MKHIVKIEIDNKRYGIPEEVFNYIRQCCDKIQELEDENERLNKIINEFEKILEEHEATYTLNELKKLKGE